MAKGYGFEITTKEFLTLIAVVIGIIAVLGYMFRRVSNEAAAGINQAINDVVSIPGKIIDGTEKAVRVVTDEAGVTYKYSGEIKDNLSDTSPITYTAERDLSGFFEGRITQLQSDLNLLDTMSYDELRIGREALYPSQEQQLNPDAFIGVEKISISDAWKSNPLGLPEGWY